MGVSDIGSYLYKVNEYWARKGPPKSAFNESGALCKMLRKDLKASWGGDEKAKLAVDYIEAGNVGALHNLAVQHATYDGGAQFQVPCGELWTILQMTWRFLEFTKQPGFLRDGMTGQAKRQMRKMESFFKALSYTVWGDGTGNVAKGDGAYSVAGTTITLKNARCAKRFAKNDVLQFRDASTGAIRPGTVTVSKVQRRAGKLVVTATINAAGSIPAAVNTDYILKAVDADSSLVMNGVFSWVPLTHAKAATTFCTVDRTDDVERLAGWRLPLTGTETPWQICMKICALAADESIAFTDIFVPTDEVEVFMNEAKAHRIEMRDVTTETSRLKLTMGVTALELVFPGMDRPTRVVTDPFMNDIEVAAKDDRTYMALNMDCWDIQTTPSGLGWVDQTGNGRMQQIAGTQQVISTYGMMGNAFCDNPGANIVASPRATDS